MNQKRIFWIYEMDSTFVFMCIVLLNFYHFENKKATKSNQIL